MKKMVSVLCVVALLFVCPVDVDAASVSLRAALGGYSMSSSSDFRMPFVDGSVVYTTTDSGGQSRDVFAMYVYEGIAHYALTGFSRDSTYDGACYFDLSTPLMSSGSIYCGEVSLSLRSLPYVVSSGDTIWQFRAPSQRVQMVDVFAYLPDGSMATVDVMPDYGFSINLDNVYFSSGDPVIRLDVTYRAVVWCFKSFPSTGTLSTYDVVPFYYFNVGYSLPPYFSGDVIPGKNVALDRTADLINENNDKIAAAQASQAAAEHEDTVNGFDDTKGQQVNKDLQDGIAVYESQEDAAHQDFDSKMDAYEDPDVSDYVSGVSFISSAVVMWWNALGMFKVILLVGFSLMIFNFISRFRGG